MRISAAAVEVTRRHSFTMKCNTAIQWPVKELENKLNIYSQINHLEKVCVFYKHYKALKMCSVKRTLKAECMNV